MKQYDKLSGILGIVIGIVFCIGSYSLGLGRQSEPGPGFLPFLVGALIVFLSTFILINALREKSQKSGNGIKDIKKFRKVGLILLTLTLYNILLSYIGFAVTTFFFVIFLMKIVENQHWVRTLVTAFLVSVGFYGAFQFWLQLDFPLGPWGF